MKKITFVCTGNTCRSVMAQQLLKKVLAVRGIKNVEVDSAGTAASPRYAIIGDLKEVMDEEGIEYGGHTPKMINEDILNSSDLVLAAARAHVEDIKSRFDVRAGKVRLMSAYAAGEVKDVEDPIGFGKAAYERVFRQIKSYIEKIAEKEKNET